MPRRASRAALVVVVALLVCVAWARTGSGPLVVATKTFDGPGNGLIATLELVDNGLGFGLGAIFEEVHITSPIKMVGTHGQSGESVVFVTEANDEAHGKPVEVVWIDARDLRITFDAHQRPGTQQTRSHGVDIGYAQRPN